MMKKIALVRLLFVLGLMMVPVVGLATSHVPQTFPTAIEGELATDPASFALTTVNTFSLALFVIFLTVGILFVVWSALQFVTGGPEKASEARQKMLWGFIGIGFAILASFFDDIAASMLGITLP